MDKEPITSPLATADKAVTGAALRSSVVDLIDLSLIGKQAHWNVVGRNFRSVHLQLDELVAMARRYTDAVAERAVALGVSPNGMAKTVASGSGAPDYPEGWRSDTDTVVAIAATLGKLIGRMRNRIDQTDKTDLVTQDLLIDIANSLEKAHWMWEAQLA